MGLLVRVTGEVFCRTRDCSSSTTIHRWWLRDRWRGRQVALRYGPGTSRTEPSSPNLQCGSRGLDKRVAIRHDNWRSRSCRRSGGDQEAAIRGNNRRAGSYWTGSDLGWSTPGGGEHVAGRRCVGLIERVTGRRCGGLIQLLAHALQRSRVHQAIVQGQTGRGEDESHDWQRCGAESRGPAA